MLGQLEPIHSASFYCVRRIQSTYLKCDRLVHPRNPLWWLHVQVRKQYHSLGACLGSRQLDEGWNHVCRNQSCVQPVRSLYTVRIAVEAIRDAHRPAVVVGRRGMSWRTHKRVFSTGDSAVHGVCRWLRTSPVARCHASWSRKLGDLGVLLPASIRHLNRITVTANHMKVIVGGRLRKIHRTWPIHNVES